MTFTDRFVKPNYVAELSSIDGSISAVSSSNPQPAKVKVTGRVYTTAPLSISGVVQPRQVPGTDLKASAKGVDLPRFNTYSAKYVAIPSSAASCRSTWNTRSDRALTASNHAVLNQRPSATRPTAPTRPSCRCCWPWRC